MPWDEETCESAAQKGHLDVLMYARENGCPWDDRTWRYADESVQKWLKKNGCPGIDESDDDESDDDESNDDGYEIVIMD